MKDIETLKAFADEADKRGDKEAAFQAMQMIKEIQSQEQKKVAPPIPSETPVMDNVLRQTGLFLRHGAQGVADVADMFTGPIRYGLSQFGVDTPSLGQLVENSNFPKPETQLEGMVATPSEIVAGGGPFIKAGTGLAKMGNNVLSGMGRNLSAAPGMQMTTAAATGAGVEGANQTGLDGGTSFGVGVLAGLTPSGVKSAATTIRNKLSTQDIDSILQQAGIELRGMTIGGQNEIRAKVKQALDAGTLDVEQLKRLADYKQTNTTATRAGVTQDPIDITQQKNLAKTGANTNDPRVQELARIENQNAKQLTSELDDLAEGAPTDLYSAGDVAITNIQGRNNQLLGIQSKLYDKAKNLAGRDVELNRDALKTMVSGRLKKEGKELFLPKKIKKLIYSDEPMTVDDLNSYQTVIANAIHKASRAGDGNTVQALKQVQKSLLDVPISGAQPQEVMKAFRNARKFSRKMYQWQESIPAIKAVIDGASPDKFMQDYILGNTSKASVANVRKLAAQIKGDKEASAIVKNQIAAWLRDKAVGGEGRINAKTLEKALETIGDRKLGAFFSKSEINKLHAIKRVALYESNQPAGSAVNNSNSATTAAGMFFNWIANQAKFLPGGEIAVTMPIRAASNRIGANRALNYQIGEKTGNDAPLALPIIYGANASAN